MIEAHDPVPDGLRRRALACADFGVFEIDPKQRSITLDQRARELLGLSTDGALTLDDYLATIDASDRDRVVERLARSATSAGAPYHDEFKTHERRWIAVDGRAAAGMTNGSAAVVGVVSDITLRRATDDARGHLVDEMARSLRFNEMLVGVVAHDIRNPLSAVLTASDSLAQTAQDPSIGRAGALIARSAQRIARIIDQLLDLTHARLDGRIPLHPRDVDLAVAARQTAVEVSSAVPAAAVNVEARGDTHCVCDPDRVLQVLSNLVGNAVKHGGDPGAVRVVVDGTGERSISVSVINPGAIAAEIEPLLFNPFARVQRDSAQRDRSRGLGLGLYIARRIVLGHGGDIEATSSPDAGTTFRVELPRAGAPTFFSLTPDAGEEEAVSLARIGDADQQSRVTSSLFGVMALHERSPDAFKALVEHHGHLLTRSLDRQIYRDVRVNLASELRALAEQLAAMGATASDVTELHSRALKEALRKAPALKAQALVAEGRLLALELMGRLLTVYRKRSGFSTHLPAPAARGE